MTAATRRQGSRLDGRETIRYYYYLVRLMARNPETLFDQHPILQETMRSTWTGVMNVYPLVKPDVFVLTPRRLQAIVCVADGLAQEERPEEEGFFSDLLNQSEGVPDLVVERAIEFYRVLCVHGTDRILREEGLSIKVGQWGADFDVRLLEKESDIERLRSEIIQGKIN